MFFRRFALAVLILGMAGGARAARKPGDPLKPGFNLFSKSDDISVGQENAKQVLAQYDVVKNQFLQDYVQRLGQKLAAAPEASGLIHPTSSTWTRSTPLRCPAVPCSSTPASSRQWTTRRNWPA